MQLAGGKNKRKERMNNASVSQINPEPSVSDGQFQEINQAALRGTVPFISRLRQVGGAQRFVVGNVVAEAVASALLSLLPKRVRMSSEEVEFWQKYYHDNHNIKADFSELEVPAPVDYPTRLSVMHEAISNNCNRAAGVYEKHVRSKGFGWYQFTTDLDASVKSHSRSGTYAIRVRDVREAEFGFVNGKNLSTQDVWDRGIATTTLPERFIDGDVYLFTKEEHLDQEKITLCGDSKTASGRVPSVSYNPGDRKLYVAYWYPSNANGYLRFRPAILA